MQQYSVKGMSCAACSARVEGAVSRVEGVSSCAVSLLTNSMGVEGSAAPEAIIAAVEAAGYSASLSGYGESGVGSSGADILAAQLEDTEAPRLKKRFLTSLGFLLVLMYIAMGPMLGLPLPDILAQNAVSSGIAQLVLAGICMVINSRFFVNGFKGLVHRAPNMDTLVALGSSSAFIYSLAVLFIASGNSGYSPDYYFDSSAMILTLITVGKLLEVRSKGKTTDALKGLIRLSPKEATVLRDGVEQKIPVDWVRIGDIFLLKPGDSVPVDGIITEGSGAVDESALTGESIPVDKLAGDSLLSAAINLNGYFKVRAERVGENTTLARIIRIVSEAAASKAPIARIADRVSGIFVPAVMGISAVTLAIWLIVGESFGFALARAISVLVISCPCALGLATPVAIMVGSGKAAGSGILFKTAESLEETGKTEIAVLDKTGTVTMGKPSVTDIAPAEGVDEELLLTLAGSIERLSEHPLASAVCGCCGERAAKQLPVSDFKALPGNGLSASISDGSLREIAAEELISGLKPLRRDIKDGDDEVLYRLIAGSAGFICSELKTEAPSRADELAEEGKTPMLFAVGGKLLGIIAVADPVKDDSVDAIEQLKGLGIRVVMLTGDNRRTAAAIASRAGVDEVIAGVLPEGKGQVVTRLRSFGRVAMVGDGINDAPALSCADVGIAIGSGADIAIDAADVVLMNSSLRDVAAGIRLSRATLRNIKENLFWAFFYNSICIPLAAGALIPLFGIQLNPMIAAAAMSLSSFTVVSNALRLNLFRPYDSSGDYKIKHKSNSKERIIMEKTMKIDGMMCPHCEARVKKALEGLENVDSALVSHSAGTAIVTGTGLEEEKLKATVEAAGYEVLEIK